MRNIVAMLFKNTLILDILKNELKVDLILWREFNP